MKKSNLKAVPTERPEPMDWYLIDRLASGIAQTLGEDQQALVALMLLFEEIARHRDQAGGIADHVTMHLFAWHTASNRAFVELMAQERTKLAEGAAS